MLTFVLLYIIIITSLGVITPTYVNIYMYIFLHMYSGLPEHISGRFRRERCSHPRKKWAFIVHFTSLVVRWVTSQICSFLSFRGTHHVLLVHLGSFPPVLCIRWVSPKKEAFFQNGCLERTAIRLCKRDTRKCVFLPVDYVDFWFSL